MENDRDWHLNEEIVDMLYMICRYLNMCCDLDSNCILMMFKDNSNLVYDLIECLNINAINKSSYKMSYEANMWIFKKLLMFPFRQAQAIFKPPIRTVYPVLKLHR